MAAAKQPRFYLRIDRTDGSRTYKGPFGRARIQREMDAWVELFPGYACELVPTAEGRADVRRFDKATANGEDHYYPDRN